MLALKRIGLALAVLLVLLLLATAVTGTILARRGFPQTSGEAELPGLAAPVEVTRDAYGVPTISASSSQDLFRAQGYVHAQDRFWEMDMRRHVTAGRVSELFGESQIDTDRFIRTLGWRRIAEQEVEQLDEETTSMLEAYAEGVNAWMGDRSGSALSFEHALLPLTGARGYEPEPWTPVDSVAWLKAMAWDLRSNLEDELMRGRLQGVDLGEGRDWQDLWPAYPEDRHPVILPEGGTVEDGEFRPAEGGGPATSASARLGDGSIGEGSIRDGSTLEVDAAVDAALEAATAALEVAPQALGDGSADGIGSNSWVVGPGRSATGSALLANDPHLGPSQPSLWYQVGLRCEPVGPDCPYTATGFSFSGMPGVIIGHTDRVGWGFTNLGPDVADLVIERIDGDRYLTEDGWEELEVSTETIRVAGGDDVEITVRRSRNGPLFSDVSDAAVEVAEGPLAAGADDADADADTDTAEDAAEGTANEGEADETYAVALRWVALDPVPTAEAMPRFLRARDWDGFRDAASRLEVPSQNLVYADVDGHIGYQAPGRIPVRRTGDGTVPLPGWTGEFGWERFLDFEELPWQFDPPSGVISTANQPVLPDGSEPFLTADANRGYRGARISELLEGRDNLTVDAMLDLQLDDHNGGAERLVPSLLAVDAAGDPGVADVQRTLEGWDRRDDADSSGAAAFNATWRAILARTFHDELPEWAWPRGGAQWWEIVGNLIDDPGSAWWDDLDREGTQTRDDILFLAMSDAHEELVDRFSADPATWRWGAMHRLRLTHGTFGESGIGPVERLFNRGPLETSGGSDVVNATGWTAHEGYEVIWVPSMRMVLDMGDLDAGRWINLTGQSGRPFHPHYTDQAEPWRDGDTIPIAFSAEATDAAAERRLTLVPLD